MTAEVQSLEVSILEGKIYKIEFRAPVKFAVNNLGNILYIDDTDSRIVEASKYLIGDRRYKPAIFCLTVWENTVEKFSPENEYFFRPGAYLIIRTWLLGKVKTISSAYSLPLGADDPTHMAMRTTNLYTVDEARQNHAPVS